MRALELAAILDHDFLGGLARVGANSLDLEEKIEKLNYVRRHNGTGTLWKLKWSD